MSTPDGPRPHERVEPQRARLRDAHLRFEAACDEGAQAVDELRGALDVLRGAFGEHVEFTEGPGGLFEEMQDDAPVESAVEVDRLRRDHITVTAIIDRIDELLDRGAQADDERLVDATAELVRLLHQHRRRGAELLFDVYDVDVGGSG